MTTAIQIHSLNTQTKTKNKIIKIGEKSFEQKNNILTADAVSFKGIKPEFVKNEQVTKSASNSFLTEVANACKALIGLFKIKDKTIDFEKMSRKEIKTFLAQRQFRLSFDSSYEKYNIFGKPLNIVTKCKKHPEFAKEVFNMKEKDFFHSSRFDEQDIAELFLSYELNPKLTKELLNKTNPDGSFAFGASTIRTLVEMNNDELVQDCLKILY